MFLPPAVMMMSFLRSVIFRWRAVDPVSDVPGGEPAVRVDRRAGRLRVPVVAGETPAAAARISPSRGDADLDALRAAPDGSELQTSRSVAPWRRRSLGHAQPSRIGIPMPMKNTASRGRSARRRDGRVTHFREPELSRSDR